MRQQGWRLAFSLLLCAAMILVGCRPDTPPPAEVEEEPPASVEESKEVAPSPEKEVEPEEEEAAPPKERITLTVVGPSNVESFRPGEDENNNELISNLEEWSGFDLNWVILPAEEPVNALNMMMASGDPPDIVFYGSLSVFATYLHQGVLAPLDEYLDGAGYINQLVPEDTWAPVTWEGQRYAVPIPQNQNIAGTGGIFARVDWFEEMGMEFPETIEDYHEVMVRFRDEKGVIPLTATPGNGVLTGFAGAFGIGTPYKVKDGELVYSYVQPEAKEYLEYMHKLYEEGLLDEEFPINTGVLVQEKLVAGQAALSPQGWAAALPIDRAFKEVEPDGRLAYIDPPVGPNGEWGINRHGPLRTYVYVPAESDHVAEAVQFIDFMCNPEVHTYVSFGEEGVHHEVRDGEYYLLDAYQDFRWQMYYVVVDTQNAFAVRLRDKGFKVYSDQVVDYAILDPIHLYAPPIPEVMEVESDINSLVEEYFVRFITGDLPLDDFDEFIEEWRAKGGAEAEAALNRWYQEDFAK